MKKISKKTKDKIYVTFFLVGIMCLIVLMFIAIVNLFAAAEPPQLSQECISKSYAEQTLKNEIDYIAIWEYIENMSEQEYYETFYKDELKEYEAVQKKFVPG